MDQASRAVERWARVKAVVLDALEYPEPERSAFVAQACSTDPDIKEEVESLLASADAADSFCETPAARLLGSDAWKSRESGPRLPPGTRLGAYEITEFIAAGGMGQVYRARHTVLGRQVAIKTVVARLADDTAKRHLIREARHASTLAHPNICTIHEVGEAGDTPFIVMEYVAGRPLSEIVREGPVPMRDTLAYGIHIATALEHAHARGIIHRDLKSSNVVIDREGNAKVLDFGLARRLPESVSGQSRESTLTSLGALAGTLTHMAPEVLTGGRADARSDVWALGVLLYELATGELPFTGRTAFETSSAILGDPPRPMSSRVPLALRLVIERCLVKRPEGRYQRARAVIDALDAIRRRRAWPVIGRLLVSGRRRSLYVGAVAAVLLPAVVIGGSRLRGESGSIPPSRVSTLALLPLTNATGDSASDYYAQGITDALIAQLGAASDVRVLSRASTMSVARSATTPREIGERLGADVIVNGTLRRTGERVSIEAQLINATDGRVMWKETYERNARDVHALEADIVRGLAGAIQLTFRPGARERLAAIRAVSPDVYEAYLKGRYEWNKRTRKSLEAAVEHFTRAVELDPTYAPAHAALANCYSLLGTVMLGTGSPRDFRPRAAAEAIKALQIDPSLAEAHAALGYAWHYDLRWADAEREFRRAIELNPSFSLVRIWYANLLMGRSRWDEAIEQVMVARELDPFSLIVNTNVGWVLERAGRHDEAIAQLERTLTLDSLYVQAHWRLADALASAERYAEAIDRADRLVILIDSAPPALALRAQIAALAGRREEARQMLATLLARSRRQYIPPSTIAEVYAALGDDEIAVTWLEKAFEERSNAVAYFGDVRFESLRRLPRFRALLARAGLE